MKQLIALGLLACTSIAAELRVSTDFEGGSAKVEAIDQTKRVIRFMPGGDPQRGWACWWYLRVDGVAKDEKITLDLAGSDRPTRHNGKDTTQPLAASWAMPARATFSTDGQTWRHTALGKKEGPRSVSPSLAVGGESCPRRRPLSWRARGAAVPCGACA